MMITGTDYVHFLKPEYGQDMHESVWIGRDLMTIDCQPTSATDKLGWWLRISYLGMVNGSRKRIDVPKHAIDAVHAWIDRFRHAMDLKDFMDRLFGGHIPRPDET